MGYQGAICIDIIVDDLAQADVILIGRIKARTKVISSMMKFPANTDEATRVIVVHPWCDSEVVLDTYSHAWSHA